uniref:Uncharacterized protein n=1 Tax=Daphnia magna TaxID=35525 RepID=A0A0P6BZX3_9CRUS
MQITCSLESPSPSLYHCPSIKQITFDLRVFTFDPPSIIVTVKCNREKTPCGEALLLLIPCSLLTQFNLDLTFMLF